MEEGETMRATTGLPTIFGAIIRGAVFLGATGVVVLAPLSGAQAQFWLGSGPVWHGNDTGGIIPWSCENEAVAPQAAAGYCARFSKYARITGINRQYGDYISFHCFWAPNIERFARPAVATRAGACGAERFYTK
jgi:hypothetical protein